MNERSSDAGLRVRGGWPPFPPKLEQRLIHNGLVVKLALLILVAVASGLALLWVFQRSFIYFPAQELTVSADEVGFAEVVLSAEDGHDLSAWYHRPTGQPAMTVVVFNGNAGNRSHRVPLGRELADRGYGVLLVDYRGYGGNPGRPSEEGLAADARAAFAFASGEDGIALAYFGESLGAAVALGLALEHPPDALILRSPFTSLADVGAAHYPFLPVSLLLRDRFPNKEHVERLTSPLLVIAGSEDRIVPAEQSRQLWQVAPEPKQLLIIEDAGHNDFELLAGDELINEIDRFLRAVRER